jgi:hypothetical protein
MNIIFHTATVISVTILLTDTERIKPDSTIKKGLLTGLSAFVAGIITHAVLDYIPHCYPINSKIDIIVSLIIIIATLWLVRKPYKIIAGLSFLGCIFPDLIDLLPKIINNYAGLRLPVSDKIFPWHWQKYSGVINNDNCSVSVLNHCCPVKKGKTYGKTSLSTLFIYRP